MLRIELLGLLLIYANMVSGYRPSLYRRMTTRQHVERVRWHVDVPCDREWGVARNRNDARACLLDDQASRYWPRKELVTAWLREEWDARDRARDRRDPSRSVARAGRADRPARARAGRCGRLAGRPW